MLKGVIDRMRETAYRVTRAEPGELNRALLLFLYNYLVITAYLIVKPVSNSLFLKNIGPEKLPYAYIGTALFVGIVVAAYSKLVDKLSRTGVVLATWGFLSGGLLLFWRAFLALSESQDPNLAIQVSALFYFFRAVFGVLGVTQFWSFAAEVLDPRQGRRLYGFIQIGAILGGLNGAVLTSLLAPRIGTEQLLLVSSVICFVCGLVASRLSQIWPVVTQPQEAKPAGEKRAAARGGARLIFESRYLQLFCVMIFCFQMISTLVDYQFSTIVKQSITDKDLVTAFYGNFFFCLNSASFLFQSFATTRILRIRGLGPALVLLPMAGLLGSTAFFLFPVFWVGAGIRWSFGVLDYSLDRATRELLYLPTTRAVKTKAKAFIDMFCFRFFRSLAGIFILGMQAFDWPLKNYSLAVGAVALLWLLVARALATQNLREVREALLGHPEPSQLPVPDGTGTSSIAAELPGYIAGLARGEEGGESHQKLCAWAAEQFGPSDVPAAMKALVDPATRPLAQELLDGVATPGMGRMLIKSLDTARPLEVRQRLAERVLQILTKGA